jgi:dissimilatory sulfite reductase (desulfoviridin) alpha/beta subunit
MKKSKDKCPKCADCKRKINIENIKRRYSMKNIRGNMVFIQGSVITRDNIYTAYGTSKKEIIDLLKHVWENFVEHKLYSTEEFLDKIIYDEIIIGTVSIKDNTDTLYKCM